MENITESFDSFFHSTKKKFTIILGSGFHASATSQPSILNDWNMLLKHLDPTVNLSGCSTIDFERMLIRITNKQTDLAVWQIEKDVIKKVKKIIKSEQESAISKEGMNYPKWLFNPRIISDIISLNFDTVAQSICESEAEKKARRVEYELPEGTGVQPVRSYNVEFANRGCIKFWYPHGSVQDDAKTILGTRRYSENLRLVEQYRRYSKKIPVKHISWYTQLVENPVLILGASISPIEWDIWVAFVNRERNFAKFNNLQYRQPVYQMNEEKQSELHSQWFQAMFTGLTFAQQWKRMEKMFTSK